MFIRVKRRLSLREYKGRMVTKVEVLVREPYWDIQELHNE
jgi:hypothetical protein